MQATSDKTASANFTQTGGTAKARGIANNLTNKTNGYSPYYQWGRKDAFRSAQYTYAPDTDNTLKYLEESVKVGTTIQNPATHYNSNDGMPYALSFYYNAWNAKYTTYSDVATKTDGLEKVVKTVYDPCPVGYTVPAANVFIAFSTDNTIVDGNSRYYDSNGKKLYLPFNGSRFPTTSAIYQSGQTGFYCVAVAGGIKSGRILYFNGNSVKPISTISNTPNGSKCSNGMPVRPVREN